MTIASDLAQGTIDIQGWLSRDSYAVDETSHIILDLDACASCSDKPCLRICSARCFRPDATPSGVRFDHAGCLECGTCRIVCRSLGAGGVIDWEHPASAHGISYRFG